MSALLEFLEARFADDIAAGAEPWRGRRPLVEVAAKRALVDIAFTHAAEIDGEWGCCHLPGEIRAGDCPSEQPDDLELLRVLASVYSDHPGYRKEWEPSGARP